MSPPIRAAGHDRALQAALSMGILQVSFLFRKLSENYLIKSLWLIYLRSEMIEQE